MKRLISLFIAILLCAAAFGYIRHDISALLAILLFGGGGLYIVKRTHDPKPPGAFLC